MTARIASAWASALDAFASTIGKAVATGLAGLLVTGGGYLWHQAEMGTKTRQTNTAIAEAVQAIGKACFSK